MTESTVDESNTVEKFNALPWHDSKLLGFHVTRSQSSQTVVQLDVDFRENGTNSGARLIDFASARGIYADVDLLAKRLCSHDIASGHCKKADDAADEFVSRINKTFDLYTGETTDGLFLFAITLIHPAGKILILAKSFSLSHQ